ncbi:MAG: rhomboid family intramembrane serine protease [Candidatus Aenigmatarchaeota archaeon]
MAKEDLYKRSTLTYSLIALCVAIFVLEVIYGLQYGSLGSDRFGDAVQNLFNNFGFSFQNLLGGKVWTLVSSVFLHVDSQHLLLNMLALFFFGRVVEMSLGRKKFLLVFISSAVVGNLAFLAFSLLSGSTATLVIGASGAIFGLMGTAMLARPLELVFYPYLIPVPLILVAVLYTLYNIGSFLLVATSLESSDISYAAHIGGLAAGMLFGFREERSKKGFLILLFLLAVLLLTPFLWIIFQYLDVFNYTSTLSSFLK